VHGPERKLAWLNPGAIFANGRREKKRREKRKKRKKKKKKNYLRSTWLATAVIRPKKRKEEGKGGKKKKKKMAPIFTSLAVGLHKQNKLEQAELRDTKSTWEKKEKKKKGGDVLAINAVGSLLSRKGENREEKGKEEKNRRI